MGSDLPPAISGPASEFLVLKVFGCERPEQVLELLGRADHLRLRERCAGHAREHAYLVDADRLFDSLCAHIAVEACVISRPAEFDTWLVQTLDTVVKKVLREDQEALRAGDRSLQEWDPRFEFMTLSLGIQPEVARDASAAFNALPAEVRQAFFKLLIVGLSVDECIASGYGDRQTLRQRVLFAFDTMFEAERVGLQRRGVDG